MVIVAVIKTGIIAVIKRNSRSNNKSSSNIYNISTNQQQIKAVIKAIIAVTKEVVLKLIASKCNSSSSKSGNSSSKGNCSKSDSSN